MIENLSYDESSKVTNISSESQRSETVSDVINLGTKHSQTDQNTLQRNKEQRRLNSEQRKHEIEKKREERKREREVQKLEKENQKRTFVVKEKNETPKLGKLTFISQNISVYCNECSIWVDSEFFVKIQLHRRHHLKILLKRGFTC